jgi:hypothetical protein
MYLSMMQSSSREIIGLWKSVRPRAHVSAFAQDIGVKTLTAHAWVRRGSIPSEHWERIIAAAVRRGFSLTWLHLNGTIEIPRHEEAA